MVLLGYRRGLRAAELVDLRWDQVELEHALMHVRRLGSKVYSGTDRAMFWI